MILKFFGIDSQSHQKHEDDNADLGERIQKTQARGWKQVSGDTGCNPAEQGRPQQNASKHFTHDPGLPELAKQTACQPAHRQNYRELQNEFE